MQIFNTENLLKTGLMMASNKTIEYAKQNIETVNNAAARDWKFRPKNLFLFGFSWFLAGFAICFATLTCQEAITKEIIIWVMAIAIATQLLVVILFRSLGRSDLCG